MAKIKEVVNQIKSPPKIKKNNSIRFLSGSTMFDMIIGGAKDIFGFEAGDIYNIVGDNSVGKTFFAAETIATSRKLYKEKLKYNYDDCEHGCSLDSQKLYGFDLITKNTLRSNTVEQLLVNVTNFCNTIEKGECGIYVVDSLDALSAEATKNRTEKRIKAMNAGKEFDEGSYMTDKAKFLSQEFFPGIVDLLKEKNVALIIISQVREKIGITFGAKYYRTGGKAIDFYAHTVIWLAVAEKEEVSDRIISSRIKAKTTKSKTPRPFRSGFINLIFDYGIDDLGSNIEYLYDMLTKEGATSERKGIKIEFDGKDFGNNKNKLIKYIEDNSLENQIRENVIDKWEYIEDSIATVRKSKY